jgi:hypothetical protein
MTTVVWASHTSGFNGEDKTAGDTKTDQLRCSTVYVQTYECSCRVISKLHGACVQTWLGES